MSWHYLQDQEVVYWPHKYLDGAPNALLKLIPMRDQSSLPDKRTACLNGFPSGMMSKPLMVDLGVEQLTSSLEDSLVKTSVRLEPGQVLQDRSQDSGNTSTASSKKYSHRGCLSKTPRIYALMDLSPSCKTLPQSGSMQNGLLWEVRRQAPPIFASACGLLPTPTTIGNELSPSMQKWPLHRNIAKLLTHLIETQSLPTRTATLYSYNRGGQQGRVGKKRYSVDYLSGGPWIALREWMMAWPIGWTALEPLAMDRYQQWRQWLSELLGHV